MKKLIIGLVGVMQINFLGDKQAIFDRAIYELEGISKQYGFDFCPYVNLIVTSEEADHARKWLDSQLCDFVIILSTSFASGEVITKLSKLRARIGLWAIPEPTNTGEVPLNSLCSVNMQAGILTHYHKADQVKAKWFYGWTDQHLFLKRFKVTLDALLAIKNMNGQKLALVGGIAPGFNDLYYDERLATRRLGIEIERNVEFEDVKSIALGYSEDQWKETQGELTSGYAQICNITADTLEMQARFCRAYAELAISNRFSALAISCWPKMQQQFGLVTCAIMGYLNEHGIPSACEGDVPGAVSQLFLKYMSGGQTTSLLDLVAFDSSDETVYFWHCGPSAPGMADGCGTCMRQLTHSTKEGPYKYYSGYNDLVFKPIDATIMRVTGEWDRMMLLKGTFLPQGKELFSGSSGWLGDLRLSGRSISALDVINSLLVTGFQHHYPLVYGDWQDACLEAARWLDLDLLNGVAYADYLQ